MNNLFQVVKSLSFIFSDLESSRKFGCRLPVLAMVKACSVETRKNSKGLVDYIQHMSLQHTQQESKLQKNIRDCMSLDVKYQNLNNQ